MKKKIILMCLIILSLLTSYSVVKAEDYENDGYIFSYWGYTIPSAYGMSPIKTYDQFTLGITLDKPQDIFSFNNKLYIVDSGDNSLIVLNDQYETLAYIKEFSDASSDETYTLNTPSGLAVTDNYVYIADTNNNRILLLNHDYEVVDVFGTPDDQRFETLEFKPYKIAIDKTGRIYVIIEAEFEGIIELNNDGSFNRYTGVNPISMSVIEAIWRRFYTEAQLDQMKKSFSTSFTNIIIDDLGFIYASANVNQNGDDNNMIQKINTKGIDVLKRNGYHVPKGDIFYIPTNTVGVPSGPSKLVDITINDIGMYTVLDQKRGRLFTYDDEGRLLYISANKGVQEGNLSNPVALTYFNNELVVLDQKNKSLEVYGLTEFGKLVNQAISHHYNHEFEEAAEVWREVVKLNSNYEIAYVGIGKSLLKQEKYKEALVNFKLGKDKYYYGKALEGYRKEYLNNNFSVIMSIVTIGIVFIFRKPIIDLFRGDREDEN